MNGCDLVRIRALRVLTLGVALLGVLHVPSGHVFSQVRNAGPAGEAGEVSAAAAAVQPEAAGLDPERLRRIDVVVEEAIGSGQLPGAVVLVGRGDQIAYLRAFGHRAVVPVAEPMTVDTIFDLASLTKVVATATSVMILVEQGRLRLRDRVADHIPGFDTHGKEAITIAHLLTHVSGLPAGISLEPEWAGHDQAIDRARAQVPVAPPGTRFIYSDINFFLLGEIVARISGTPFDRFARTHIFEPLGMVDTTFRPPASAAARVAPTERCPPFGWPCGAPNAPMLRGTVHDPTARRMGGVAGHAGLFSTALDLARFCRAILAGGELDGARILAPLAVARMTSPATPAGEPNQRGLGWDIDSQYSANRGDLFPLASFGHTGWTGTSLWLDPSTASYVIFLSSRVHPDGAGDVVALRGRVATLAAAAMLDVPAFPRGLEAPEVKPSEAPVGVESVTTGIDELHRTGFAALRGRRVGLLTNQTGRARDGAATIDLLHAAPDVWLVALFSPEHGIRGTLDDKVPSSHDERTGLPIHSLYGETRRPTSAMLEGIDTLVIDLQDVGARFYTYASTMAYVMEEAALRGIRVLVLDRPNPITGTRVEGPMLDGESMGFTGYFRMPIRHGLTMGELARVFNGERRLGADLHVIEMGGWHRDLWFDQTGQPWINPSPNMRNLHQATLYPGIGAIEGTNLSVGRGTDTPFEQVGAPWIDGPALSDFLNRRRIPGVRFYPVTFTPTSSKFAGEVCGGVFMIVSDREALAPVRLGLEIAAALHRMYGNTFDLDAAALLFGSRWTLDRIRAGDAPALIAAGWRSGEDEWQALRSRYLLYR